MKLITGMVLAALALLATVTSPAAAIDPPPGWPPDWNEPPLDDDGCPIWARWCGELELPDLHAGPPYGDVYVSHEISNGVAGVRYRFAVSNEGAAAATDYQLEIWPRPGAYSSIARLTALGIAVDWNGRNWMLEVPGPLEPGERIWIDVFIDYDEGRETGEVCLLADPNERIAELDESDNRYCLGS